MKLQCNTETKCDYCFMQMKATKHAVDEQQAGRVWLFCSQEHYVEALREQERRRKWALVFEGTGSFVIH